MSLARAIADATGLDPAKDFIIQDDGEGPYIKRWDSVRLGPAPTQADLTNYMLAYAAKQPERDEAAFIQSISREYVTAMIRNDLFQDATALTALIAKVEAWKAAK